MATATYAAHNCDVTATDDMDLHSDAGLELDDGDIELDVDPEASAHADDGDVSIKDAATDAGAHVQADQDDFMQDREELGGDDTLWYGDEQIAGVQTSHDPGNQQTETPMQEEEDLIDYSDEEEDTPPPPTTSTYRPVSSYSVAVTDVDQTATEVDASTETETGVHDDGLKDQDDEAQTSYQDGYGYASEAQAVHVASDHSDGEDGGVQLQELDPQTNATEYQDDDDEAQYEAVIRRVTVNYEGNELWLFKDHDTDESGDWLLDDMSMLHRSLSDLFQACRAALAENITHETELGFRFDNLHSMEIYEDNTACVAVSLSRIFDLHHTLLAQDGLTDPDSFCMCLLSRPRFASLLSDVAKHVEQGSGYSGLNAAVAAGETHFVDTYSGHTTEYEGADGDGEIDGEEYEGTESAINAEPELQHTEHEEHEDQSGGSGEDDTHGASPSQADGLGAQNAVHVEEILSHGNAAPNGSVVNEAQPALHHEDEADQGRGKPQSKATNEHFDDDIVDYSDAEDDDQPAKSYDAQSPSSATVQGDEPTTDVLQVQSLEPTKGAGAYEEAVANTAENAAAQSHVEGQLGHENNTTTYEQYDQQVYDQDDAFLEFQPVDYPPEPSFGEFTNNEYAGYEDQELDQQLSNDFISGAELDYNDNNDPGQLAITSEEFKEGDDFLDLDSAAEWNDAAPPVAGLDDPFQDVTNAQEGQDGVADQPAAAAPSTTTTAISVAASSTDLQQTSPQGQKRSIDEVGDAKDDALDLTDMKRPRK